jgi:putative FmdB family regulatory protein
MPIFEYVCEQCNNSFEKLVMGSSEPECPSCHGKKLAQKFSVFSAAAPRTSSPAPAPMGGCCGGGACGLPGPCDN